VSPPLPERLGLRQANVRGIGPDRGLMARALMYLFAAGATITIASLLFTQADASSQLRVFVTAGAAYLMAGALLLGYDRLPGWTFPVFLACGTMLIEWTIYATGETGTAFAMFYFWIAIYAFYFFDRAQALAQLLLIALAYGAVLGFLQDASSGPIVRWAITTSALVVAGAMIGLLRERVDRLITKLADAARTDPVTGLMNTRALREDLELELERAKRARTPLALLVGELRNLPPAGTHSGGPDRDELLERVGATIRAHNRPIDRGARIGDSRLAILALTAGDHLGLILAEQLHARLLAAIGREAPGVEIDFGVASFPAHAQTPQSLIDAATVALAAAQRFDGGRVASYRPSAVLAPAADPVPG
jgi:diguanylate cyclase (GGDEF)-like protein